MSGNSDIAKGIANETVGAVKQDVGKVLGSPDLQVEGVVQKMKGKAQQVIGEGKNELKQAAVKVVGDLSDKL